MSVPGWPGGTPAYSGQGFWRALGATEDFASFQIITLATTLLIEARIVVVKPLLSDSELVPRQDPDLFWVESETSPEAVCSLILPSACRASAPREQSPANHHTWGRADSSLRAQNQCNCSRSHAACQVSKQDGDINYMCIYVHIYWQSGVVNQEQDSERQNHCAEAGSLRLICLPFYIAQPNRNLPGSTVLRDHSLVSWESWGSPANILIHLSVRDRKLAPLTEGGKQRLDFTAAAQPVLAMSVFNEDLLDLWQIPTACGWHNGWPTGWTGGWVRRSLASQRPGCC